MEELDFLFLELEFHLCSKPSRQFRRIDYMQISDVKKSLILIEFLSFKKLSRTTSKTNTWFISGQFLQQKLNIYIVLPPNVHIFICGITIDFNNFGVQVLRKLWKNFVKIFSNRCTMKQLGLSLTEDDVQAMMRSVGVGPHGKISYPGTAHVPFVSSD